MVTVGLYVRLEAKPGKEEEIQAFLSSGLAIVLDEPETITWYAIRLGSATFGIFDTFQSDSAREKHLSGRLAFALMQKAGDLFAQPPIIEKVDIFAAKLSTN